MLLTFSPGILSLDGSLPMLMSYVYNTSEPSVLRLLHICAADTQLVNAPVVIW